MASLPALCSDAQSRPASPARVARAAQVTAKGHPAAQPLTTSPAPASWCGWMGGTMDRCAHLQGLPQGPSVHPGRGPARPTASVPAARGSGRGECRGKTTAAAPAPGCWLLPWGCQSDSRGGCASPAPPPAQPLAPSVLHRGEGAGEQGCSTSWGAARDKGAQGSNSADETRVIMHGGRPGPCAHCPPKGRSLLRCPRLHSIRKGPWAPLRARSWS